MTVSAAGIHAAGDNTGRAGTSGSFLRMGLGARAMGMGGGSPVLGDDGLAGYYNPAALSMLEGRWFSAALHTMPFDRRISYLGYAQSFGPAPGDGDGKTRAGFGLGWLYAGVDRIDGRDFNGSHTEMLSAGEHCFYFSFALNPLDFLAIGGSGKLLNHRLSGVSDGGTLSAVGLGFDLGVYLKPMSGVRIGFTLRDVGSQYSWDTQEVYEFGTQRTDEFPVVAEGGLSFQLYDGRLLSYVSIEKIQYRKATVSTGIEAEPIRRLFVRCGVDRGVPAVGGGYLTILGKLNMRLDYALTADPVSMQENHLFTWSLIF